MWGQLIDFMRLFALGRKQGLLKEPGFRALLENIPATTYINALQGDNETLYISPQAAGLLGYTRAEFMNDPGLWIKLLHADDREDVLRESARTNVTLEPFSMDYRLIAKDGRTIWVHDEAVVVRDADEHPQYWLGVWTDITERKRAEHEARQIEDIYRNAIQAADAVPYYRDYRSHGYSFIGEGILQMTGYTAQELTPEIFEDLVQEHVLRGELAQYTYEEADRLTEAGTIRHWECDYRLVTRRGQTRWVSDTCLQVRDENDVRVGVIGILQDITARKAIEAALRNNEERYRSFIGQTTEGIRRYDLDEPIPMDLPEDEQLARMLRHMYIAECNDAFAHMYGLAGANELIGKRLGEMGIENDPKNIEALRGFIRAHYKVLDAESHEVDAEGRERFFLINTIGIVENGCLQRVWGTQRDITERKQAELALRQREAILEALTFAAERFLTVSDWRKNIDVVLERLGQAINASHAYMFEHYIEGDVQFKSMRYEWVAPGQSPDIGKAIYQNVPVRNPTFEVAYRDLSAGQPFIGDRAHLTADESAFLLGRQLQALLEMPIMVGGVWWGTIGFDDCTAPRLWTISEIDLLKVAANTVRAAIQRNIDDTEIHRLNATLEQRVQERTALLESANKELETFSYSVSHDLRAPLRAMQSFSNLLSRDHSTALDAEGLSFLNKIMHASNEMHEKIEGLLAFARLTRAGLHPRPLDLTALATRVIDTLRAAHPDRKVITQIESGLTAQGDEVLIRTVLENLLGNAWKYSARNPEAVIEFGVVPPHAPHRLPPNSQNLGEEPERDRVFFVRDNGAGFNMKYGDKLFGAFQRLHRVDEFPGHGIGLATVQRIVHRHGGRIWAEAEEGKGATFFFTLG